jgi:hypothetical protein
VRMLSLLQTRQRHTIDHGKMIDCTQHHVCQEVTSGDEDNEGDVVVDVDDDHSDCYGRRAA